MILPLLRERDADIWLLFDSCQAMPHAFNTIGRGIVTALTATGFEPGECGVAAEVGPHSFTHTLIQVLGQLSVPPRPDERPPPFTDVSLHSLMLTELSKWQISLQKDENGSYMRTMHGHHVMEPCRRRTPIYQFLSRNKVPKPIYLRPLPKIRPSASPPRQSSLLDGNDSDSRCPHVLVSVRLGVVALTDTDIEAWAEWMSGIPEGVNTRTQGVTVEAVYPSLSTLVILRMPLSTWDLLPKDNGMNLIGYVTGDNYVKSMCERLLASMSSILASRSPELDKTDDG